MRPTHPATPPVAVPTPQAVLPGWQPRAAPAASHPAALSENRGYPATAFACPRAVPGPPPDLTPTPLSENRIPAHPGVFVRDLHLPPGMDRRPALRHAPGPNLTRSGHIMPTRQGAIARAAAFFDDGSYKALLTKLVEIPSTAQDPAYTAELHRYLDQAIRPWVESMGFTTTIHPNPLDGFGPILTAARTEDPALPTVLLYGHMRDD